MRIHESARWHGEADADVLHAKDHALAIEDAGEEPGRWLVLGPDRSASLLEVVVLITSVGEQIAIHATPMRDKYGAAVTHRVHRFERRIVRGPCDGRD